MKTSDFLSVSVKNELIEASYNSTKTVKKTRQNYELIGSIVGLIITIGLLLMINAK